MRALLLAAMILVSPDQQDWMMDTLPAQHWLGLFDDKLQPVRVRMKDRGRISVDPPKPELILRDIPGVTAGPVKAAEYDEERRVITFDGQRYQLVVRADHGAELRHGSRVQLLFPKTEFVDEPHYEIVWAGDLDRDGKLDLITVLSQKYSYYPYEVWLSSKATGSEMVHRVAKYEHYSC